MCSGQRAGRTDEQSYDLDSAVEGDVLLSDKDEPEQ